MKLISIVDDVWQLLISFFLNQILKISNIKPIEIREEEIPEASSTIQTFYALYVVWAIFSIGFQFSTEMKFHCMSITFLHFIVFYLEKK